MTTVTEDLHLRQWPSANAPDLLHGDVIPEESTFAFKDLTVCKKVQNGYMWCPVTWPTNGYKISGWVSAYFLRLQNGDRLACFLAPASEQCADTVLSDQGRDIETTQPYSPPTSSVSPPTMTDAPSWLSRPRNPR